MTNSAQLSPVDKTQIHFPLNLNLTLIGTAFLVVFAAAIVLAALQPGNWPADIALMAAFP
ncbi:MAG TPA: hypothetical protein VFL62_22940 [Bradyrhizobium sp.]|uniref:hypothetical protein n=1 Tax=Bradyrhizobium sp. TaxID=376 RepID=UPI002D7F0D53|nr:hypothetical protein [Bradyrhizobium sp.]HET7889095.1 hypothetical protein [Bradyrhizobium sp.]